MDKNSYSNVRTLVFVDDDKTTNLLVERFLKGTDCNVVTFTDPDEAHAFLIDNSVDILVVDLRMPKRDGVEFIQTLQQQLHPMEIKRIIVQTGAEPESEVRAKIDLLGYELMLKGKVLSSREAFRKLLD